jgi:hypothetical protein
MEGVGEEWHLAGAGVSACVNARCFVSSVHDQLQFRVNCRGGRGHWAWLAGFLTQAANHAGHF